jgi:uncharacterized protein YihD (DUF1040 family)
MRDQIRIEKILSLLKGYWKSNPDLRLGQLVYNLARELNPDISPLPELFYMEDDELLEQLKKSVKYY